MKRATPDFQFKQFLIKQKKAGMKVGTDGVILGSAFKCKKGQAKILDVGTGTGLVALMAAQRFPDADITAIEPHHDSYLEAKDNFEHSKFKDNIRLFHTDFQNFQTPQLFDKVLVNPPFYFGDFNLDEGRDYARNIKYFPIEVFVKFLNQQLSEEGSVEFITPIEIFDIFSAALTENSYHLIDQLNIQPTFEKSAHRVLHTWSKEKQENIISQLIIEKERHVYTDEFRRLINDFYL
jgi:tRNA1Val (adenine37-N6)-methyltransferase